MMTSNIFPLAIRYRKEKVQSRVQSTTYGGKALDRAFHFLWCVIKRKKEQVYFILDIIMSYILSFGEYVEIIEPQEIRKNIQSQLKKIQEKYQT